MLPAIAVGGMDIALSQDELTAYGINQITQRGNAIQLEIACIKEKCLDDFCEKLIDAWMFGKFVGLTIGLMTTFIRCYYATNGEYLTDEGF